MYQRSVHTGVTPYSWLQHHVPWLGMVALVIGLLRDEDRIGFDPDERNG